MVNLITSVVGPLVGPECRRSVGRGWLILVRMLSAVAAGLVALAVVWWWWFMQGTTPSYLPFNELRTGLVTLLGMGVTIALVLSPAIVAGSLAGEKERGSLGLLLTTRVSALEIVLGRVAGKLSQMAAILLTGVPMVVLLAAAAGLGPRTTATVFLLPTAVAIGGAGIAAAASAVSRKGRDALMLVYLIDLLFLLSPLLGTFRSLGFDVAWLGPLNPFVGTSNLVWDEDPTAALTTSAVWLAMGVLGTAFAAWRLRPSCLRLLSGEGDRQRTRKGKRGLWVPPVGERPMLWKEVYIERSGTLGKLGKVLGVLLVVVLGVGSTSLAGVIAWHRWGPWHSPESQWAQWAESSLRTFFGDSAVFFRMLIQWAVGLRAAVAVASEREKGTWDALLTSPLEGGEIIRGKLWGSLFGLRWLVGSALLAWTLCVIFGAMTPLGYAETVGGTVVLAAFMAAVGVRSSLATSTATKAMSVTMGTWLVGYGLSAAVAGVICGVVALFLLMLWLLAAQLGLSSFAARPWFPISIYWGYTLLWIGLYLGAVLVIVSEAGLRFDRIAGRMAGGKVGSAVDRFLHGRPSAPVMLGKGHKQPAHQPAELDDFLHQQAPSPVDADPLTEPA